MEVALTHKARADALQRRLDGDDGGGGAGGGEGGAAEGAAEQRAMEQMAGIVLHQQLQSEGVAEGARPTGPTALKPCEPPISTLFFDVFDTVDKRKQTRGAGRVDLDYIRNVIVKLLEVRSLCALSLRSAAPATL